MPADPDQLLSLAEAISDGRSIDWTSTESLLSDPDEREALRQLRLLAGMAGVHRPGGLDDGLSVPAHWGRLEILERIGFGSQGSVYRARETGSGRIVALKLLDHPAPEDAATRAERRRLLASIRHRHLVAAYGAGDEDGRAGLWMELIEGRPLHRIVRVSGPFSAREAAGIGIELCDALAALHARGLAHGAVRPGNVIRETGGRTVLLEPEGGDSVARDLQDLGALLRSITGDTTRLSAPFLAVLERAVTTAPEQRFASAAAMRHALAEVAVGGSGRATTSTWHARAAAWLTRRGLSTSNSQFPTPKKF
jgi:serine/threonine protein kinase